MAKTSKQSASKSKKSATKSSVKSVAASAGGSKFKLSKLREISTEGLRAWNLVFGVLLAVQAAVILFIGNTAQGQQGVTTNFLTKDTLASSAGGDVLAPASRHLFDVNVAYLVVALLLFAALVHVLLATVKRRKYEAGLDKKVNKVRWVSNIVTMGLTVVILGLLNGIIDISTLLALVVFTKLMNITCYALEAWNKKGRLASMLCAGAGVTPWVILAVYVWGAMVYGNGLPMFVYWLDGSLLVLFALFVRTMRMMQSEKGKWSNYLYGERMYLVLGFVSASALAWQVFFGLLR